MDRITASYPSDPAIQGEMGQINLNALNQPYLASVYFKRALDTDPQDLTSLNGLGLAYLNMHDYPNAVAQFKRCIAVDSATYSCYLNLGSLRNSKVAIIARQRLRSIARINSRPSVAKHL